jgi:hypothetical protein
MDSKTFIQKTGQPSNTEHRIKLQFTPIAKLVYNFELLRKDKRDRSGWLSSCLDKAPQQNVFFKKSRCQNVKCILIIRNKTKSAKRWPDKTTGLWSDKTAAYGRA